MKKKIVMKKWVEVVLLIIAFICMLICMSECDNTLTFFINHLLGGVILFIIGMLFVYYGRSDD